MTHQFAIGGNKIYDAVQIICIVFAIWFTKWFPKAYRQKRYQQIAQRREDPSKNIFLQGNYAPIHDELDISDLSVKGELPKNLSGIYMRNGPNPEFEPISYLYPFDGDGMLHALYFTEGKVRYKNKYVETKELQAERAAGHALYGGIQFPFPPDPKWAGETDSTIKMGAFIHIIQHAGHYLAMHEASPAYEMTQELDTKGHWQPDNSNGPFSMNAHARLDPRTGELYTISYDIKPPYLTLSVIDKNGALMDSINIDKPYATMIHDFVLTKNYVVIFDCPLLIGVEAMRLRGKFFAWQQDFPVRIGLLHRRKKTIQWHETDTFFVFHFANAYEKNDNIIVDYIRHQQLDIGNDLVSESCEPAVLHRIAINITSGKVTDQRLSDYSVEFPKINEYFNSNANNYCYMPANSNIGSNKPFNALLKYSSDNGSIALHDFGEHAEVGEAVFIPDVHIGDAEDAGYVGLYVYHTINKNSEFVLLDAQDITKDPIASVQLPRRVPHGLHGSWFSMPKNTKK